MKFNTSLFMRPSSQQKIVGSVACNQALVEQTSMGMTKNLSSGENRLFSEFLNQNILFNAKNSKEHTQFAKNGLDRAKIKTKKTPKKSATDLVEHRLVSSKTATNNSAKINRKSTDMANEAEESWQYNRRWLGTVFLIWFFLAFALLLNAIYY